MLSGLPTGFTARAHEDTLCYRIAADVALPVLADPESLRSSRARCSTSGRSCGAGPGRGARDPAHLPVSALIRGDAVVVAPETTIREAARRWGDAGDRGRRRAAAARSGSSPTATCARASSPPGVAGDAPISA